MGLLLLLRGRYLQTFLLNFGLLCSLGLPACLLSTTHVFSVTAQREWINMGIYSPGSPPGMTTGEVCQLLASG